MEEETEKDKNLDDRTTTNQTFLSRNERKAQMKEMQSVAGRTHILQRTRTRSRLNLFQPVMPKFGEESELQITNSESEKISAKDKLLSQLPPKPSPMTRGTSVANLVVSVKTLLRQRNPGRFGSLARNALNLSPEAKTRLVEKAWMTRTGLDKSTIESIERNWGRKTFGINKGGITRAICNFTQPPEPHPMTVCFHFPACALGHVHVMRLMNGLLASIKDGRITSIKFIDRNVIHGTRGLDNRWLVTLTSSEARDYLVSSGLPLFNKVIHIRLYDDVLHEDYEAYLRYHKYQKHLNPKLKVDDAVSKWKSEDSDSKVHQSTEQSKTDNGKDGSISQHEGINAEDISYPMLETEIIK